ncbi:MAG TPA: DUF4190 domain-containing protein [Terriglobales bacterium]|nr:DUF4190 domain-containing protein [Terriglobales bacterium]
MIADGSVSPSANTSGKAITSLICGLFCWLLPAAILAIVFGHISRSEIARSRGRLKGSGMALVGLILGYAGISMIPFLIVAAIVIPNLLRARISANEASAVASVRALDEAELSYKAAYPTVGYAAHLSNLGGVQPCTASPETACLLDDRLATAEKNGYKFEAIGSNPASGVNTIYVVGGAPLAFNQSGVRRFCSTEDRVTRWDVNSERSTIPPDHERCQQFAPI